MDIAYMIWRPHSEVAQIHIELMRTAGHQVVTFPWNGPMPAAVDAIITDGPEVGSLVPVGKQLAALPPSKRPRFALWMSEQFWDPRLPNSLGRALSQLRFQLEERAYLQQENGHWRQRRGWGPMIARGHRFRYFGEISSLQRAGLLSVLAVHSLWIAAFLKRNGIQASVIYRGYAPLWESSRRRQRDVPVLWLGKMGSRRRQRLLRKVRQELGERGVSMMFIDGVEQPYVFGAARNDLLQRTRIAVNVLRQPWDNNHSRYLLAMSNGALIVGEPTYQHTPFRDGEHLILMPVPEMADVIIQLLADEPRRAEIARQAYQFITTEFTMERGVQQLLAAIDGSNNR